MLVGIFMVLYIKYGKQSNLAIKFIFNLPITEFAIAVLLSDIDQLSSPSETVRLHMLWK